MEIKIESIPSCRIVYIRQTGPYGANNKRIMEKLKTFAKDNNLFDDESVILGIAQDDPNETKIENCRYDVCLVVNENYKLNSNDIDINLGSIVGGKYAVFIIEHTKEEVQKAWSEIFKLLSMKRYKMDISRPIVERYANKMIKNHKCEICVPIE